MLHLCEAKANAWTKPISEFCLSDFKLCTPSYYLLPNCLKLVARYSTDLAADALNDYTNKRVAESTTNIDGL